MDATRYFIRNDDVGARTPALIACVETFLRAELPVSYQVIPEKLTPECGRWLRELQAAHPHLIEFGQHGLRHEMVVRGKRVWREFGPERCYAAQLADIVSGKAILEDRLGPITLFTPPQHKYDGNTLRALERSGFETLSAASYPTRGHRVAYAIGRALGRSSFGPHGVSRHGGWRSDARLFEASVSVAIDDGGALRLLPGQIATQAGIAARQTSLVGFMLHHHVFASQIPMLAAFADKLRLLDTHRFSRIADLAR